MLNNLVFAFLQSEHIPACVRISSAFKDCWNTSSFENVLVSTEAHRLQQALGKSTPDTSLPAPIDGVLNPLRGNKHFCFVALQGDKVVGFACFLVLDNEINLEMVAVCENHHHRGIAYALLAFALDNLKKLGANICFLEGRCSNFAASKLYDKLGFETVCIRPKMYSLPCEDGFLMRLDFASS